MLKDISIRLPENLIGEVKVYALKHKLFEYEAWAALVAAGLEVKKKEVEGK